MLCSGPEELEYADLNGIVLWAAIQIVQSFITWINEPSQISTPHYWLLVQWSMLSLLTLWKKLGIAVLYQKSIFFFFTMTQLAEVATVKITVWHFCGTDYVCNNEFHYSGRQWKLINKLRCCFYKHAHFCEISDKLQFRCDVKHKNNLSYPAITIWTISVRYKQICDCFYGSVWPTGHDTSVVMQNFWHALLHV